MRRFFDEHFTKVIAWMGSLGFHGLILCWFFMSPHLSAFLQKNVDEKNKNILIDLSDLENFDEKVSLENLFVSQKNRAFKGKINDVEEKGVHLRGRDGQKPQKSSAFQNPSQQQTPSQEKKTDTFKTKGAGNRLLLKNNRLSFFQKSSKHLERKKALAKMRKLITENTTNYRFNFSLDQTPQIGSRKEKHAEFYLAFFKVLKKQFVRYVASSRKNIEYVNPEEVMAIGQIDRSGQIDFLEVVQPSRSQPYFNYLAEKTIDKPGKLSQVPAEFFGKNEAFLFSLSIRFTGPPENQWWFGYDFYKP